LWISLPSSKSVMSCVQTAIEYGQPLALVVLLLLHEDDTSHRLQGHRLP